jgi:DNA-directed RNA polymerase specialized sigma24 family protein
MLTQLTTSFVNRLRTGDESAWFELWETFGPVLRAQLTRWGKGRIGPETVRDLSQETLAALSDSLHRFDPSRGARFSTWLLAIAKHVLGDEMDRRMALKRGGGKANAELDESWMGQARGAAVDREADFTDFSIYRMRVFDGQSGKEVASALGISEPTVSRRLAKIRDLLRSRIIEVVSTYSFTREELDEAQRNGLTPNPKSGDDRASDTDFDDCLAEIYHRQMELRARDEETLLG